MTKIERVRATNELAGVTDVLARYQRSGPHATVITELPAPGQTGDDRAVRWHVRRSELIDAGASSAALGHLDALVDTLEPRGESVLLTADDNDATFCWLIDHAVDHLAHVGPCPALLAALAELSDRTPVIVGVVDHLGADLFELDHLDLTEIGSVKGDQVQTHRHTGGDQAGYQRRSEAVYERNADTIARQITEHAVHAAARLVVHVLPLQADHVHQQPLGQPVLAHDPGGLVASVVGEHQVPVVADDEQTRALHPGHRLRDGRATVVQPLGDPGPQRDDALFLQLEDGPQVHLGGVDQVAHDSASRVDHALAPGYGVFLRAVGASHQGGRAIWTPRVRARAAGEARLATCPS